MLNLDLNQQDRVPVATACVLLAQLIVVTNCCMVIEQMPFMKLVALDLYLLQYKLCYNRAFPHLIN